MSKFVIFIVEVPENSGTSQFDFGMVSDHPKTCMDFLSHHFPLLIFVLHLRQLGTSSGFALS